MDKKRAPRNRTLSLTDVERKTFRGELAHAAGPLSIRDMANRVFNDDLFGIVEYFPQQVVDLMIVDPPYNLDKDFGGFRFSRSDDHSYEGYLSTWFPQVVRLLKPSGSLYICGDWLSSSALYRVVSKFLTVRNRITWQREKGRGAKANWKNCTEDIWFATASNDYYFDVESVKVKRKVIAPYRENGKPKDWQETSSGNFRLTHPSNFWDDLTVPYWSMPENTDHPTQKPEKLLAKLILASCPENGLVFDPFLGSGTTAVVARKLGRRYCGVEINEEYCCWAQKRLHRGAHDTSIQGYCDGVFWERNTLNVQGRYRPAQPVCGALMRGGSGAVPRTCE